MTCIYCQVDKTADSFRKAEHVIPQSFGRFKDNFTLRGSVCDDCNQYFGDNLELALARDTVEGTSRVDFEVQAPEDFRPFGRKGRLIVKVAEGEVKGAYAYREFSEEQEAVISKPAPQIGIRKANSPDYQFFLIHDLPERNKLGEEDFDLANPNCFLILGINAEAAKQILDAKGFNFKFSGHAGRSENAPPNWMFELEQTVDFVIARAVAKIGFNYLAFFEGRDFVMHEDFNLIRRFIRYGEKPAFPVVVVDDKSILADEPVGGKSRLGHIVTVNWAADRCSVVSQVSLFNWLTYSICLARDFSGPRRDIRRGHFLNIRGRDICSLDVR